MTAPAWPASVPSEPLALAYAQNFWDAGNSIVTVMFALAFGVYFALIQFEEVRRIVAKYFRHAVVLAIIGNVLLGFVICRLYMHERTAVSFLTNNADFLYTLKAGLFIREGMLVFNFLMYLGVLIFVRDKVGKVTGLTSDAPK